MRRARAARRGSYDHVPSRSRQVDVITAAILFLVCCFLLAVCWFGRHVARKRARRDGVEPAAHSRRVGRHAVRRTRTGGERGDHDNTSSSPSVGRGNREIRAFRTEDDYPTAIFPRKVRECMEDTDPIISPVRPYIDKPRYGRRDDTT